MKTLPHKMIHYEKKKTLSTNKLLQQSTLHLPPQRIVRIPFHVHINHKGFVDTKATFQ